jgi:hypothetical protein
MGTAADRVHRNPSATNPFLSHHLQPLDFRLKRSSLLFLKAPGQTYGYSARTERHHRRAVQEFDRLKARHPPTPNEPILVSQPQPTAPAAMFGETNPISPEPPHTKTSASIFANLPRGSNFRSRNPPTPLAASAATSTLEPESREATARRRTGPPVAEG